MPFHTLISSAELAAHLGDSNWAVVDCRYDLMNAAWGEPAYREAHIPGAVYAHMDRDLAGPKTGRNGRHPLPDAGPFQRRMADWGIGPETQVVAYDQDSGMWASRLWWLLRYYSHEAVAVLDGGLAQWMREGRPVRAGEEQREPRPFTAIARDWERVTAEDVERLRADPAYRLIDSRTPERYRGEREPIDPVAGRIPGAVNVYNLSNVNVDGTFLAPEALRAKFLSLLGDVPPENVVAYCGSGIAAAHNILALEYAGLPGAKLYVGSWSEWCSDPGRPVARDA
jgi:thiosulfate/3-mercaptopyruvate sulfurtransferase